MIKALRYTILLMTAVLFLAAPASATVKFDVSKGAGKVTTTVSGWMETAKKQMDESATLQTMISMGKGAIETAKKMKALADTTKGAITGAIAAGTGVVNEAQNSVGDVKSGAMDAAGGAVGDAVGGVVSKTGDAQKLLGLKQEKLALESARDDAVAAAQEEFNAKIKLANDNIKVQRNLIEQEPQSAAEHEAIIADYESQIAKYQDELAKTKASVEKQYSSQIEGVDAQLTELRNEAASKAGDAAAKKLKSLMGGDDEDAQKMEDMIKNNFLAEDEEQTNENILRIRTYRKLTAAKDTVDAFNNAWRIKKTRFDNNEKAEKVQGEVPQMEGSSSSLLMDIQLKVENINALLEYTRMMVKDMKMKTANELAEKHNWKLTRYGKAPTEFNLDDYVFDKKSTKDKLLGLAKDIKKNGLKGAAENAVGGAVEKAQKAQDAGADKPNSSTTTDDPLEAVRAELRNARAGSGHYEGVDEAGPSEAAPVNVDDELAAVRGSAS